MEIWFLWKQGSFRKNAQTLPDAAFYVYRENFHDTISVDIFIVSYG
jgi:hypothetical protein